MLNSNETSARASKTLRALLTDRAAGGGDKAAVLDVQKRTVSYTELLGQADRVSRSLAAVGIRAGDRVALFLPDGPDLAAAFLGVAASVPCAPLNPGYRDAELLFFLSDLRARAVVALAGDSASRRAAERLGIAVLELMPDRERPGLFRLSPGTDDETAEPLPAPSDDDVALLLHTSGTTSRPKLVPLTHANLRASASHIHRALRLTAKDRCLSVMPLFHIHGLVAALLSSLEAGGSVVCTPGFDATRFFDWIDALEPTWYTAVPTIHQSVLKRAGHAAPVLERRRLRFLRSSSAALPAQIHSELETVFRAPVIEAYGMTEASHQMASNPLPPGRRKPGSVGLPSGPEIAILGPRGEILPAGARGEIGIRGPNVMRGYEGNPTANDQAFVSGWFRTGDEGVVDLDGYVTLTGRLKEIINRGGEKVAPREIDEALLAHPAVAQAVAFAIPDPRLGEEVGAAVVLKENAEATPLELREFVASRLADFKVPRRIVLVSEIPKGPTGKLQRIGLAEKLGVSVEAAPASELEALAPRNPVEADLLRIWVEVLGLEGFGVTGDFFALGGDSLLATQIVARVRERLGADLSVVALFETPTVEGMAESIAGSRPASEHDPDRISARPAGTPAPLSFAQEGLWFLEQLDPGGADYARPANVRIRGPLDVPALERALAEVLRRHEVLRTSYRSEGDGPTAAIHPPADFQLPVLDLSAADSEERERRLRRLAREEASTPFDLAAGPVIRTRLLRLAKEEHLLLVTVHHIAFDQGSMGILLRELAVLYGVFSASRSSPLPEPALQFGDFAAWQRARLSPSKLEPLLDHWHRRLAGAPSLTLPTDSPREDREQGSAEGSQPFDLVTPKKSELAALAHSENASLFMVLAAGYLALLHARTGQEDMLLATDVAARGRVETEELIGYFGNILLLRTSVAGDPTFRELLLRVRTVALEAYRYGEVPFANVVMAVRPRRVAGKIPFVRSVLVLHGPVPPRRFGATSFEAVDLGAETPRFDLGLLLDVEGDRLSGRWRYRRELFEDSTVWRLSRDLARLFARVASDPAVRLDTLAAELASPVNDLARGDGP